jgi:hypothetical protein
LGRINYLGKEKKKKKKIFASANSKQMALSALYVYGWCSFNAVGFYNMMASLLRIHDEEEWG